MIPEIRTILEFTVPEFNYLDPGNTIDNDPSTNHVNKAARHYNIRPQEISKFSGDNSDSFETFKIKTTNSKKR